MRSPSRRCGRPISRRRSTAADWPDARLKGVTAYQARMMAANVLSRAGDHIGALNVLDRSPDTAGAGLILRAGQSLDAGDFAGAQPLVSQIRTWPVGDSYGISLIMTLVLTAADAGYFDSALLADSPPWPGVVDGRLLWWPDAEYQRLVAQVPDVRYVLGPPGGSIRRRSNPR
jgi:hypothetical protein